MFIKYEKRKRNNGEILTYVSVVEGYRDINGKVKQRRIKSYGALENQENPDEFIRKIEEEIKILETQENNRIEFTLTDDENKNNSVINKEFNYGYKYLEAIYDELKIDEFFDSFQKESKMKSEYSVSEIFKFLTLQRILNPDSKRATTQKLTNFYNKDLNFSLDDVYRSLTKISNTFDSLQTHLRAGVDRLIKNKSERIYYDVTNYYFEIDFNDPEENFRHKGVSKEHRLDPIIGLGLFLDNNGIPLRFNIFNGNTAESLTLISELEKVKNEYNLERIITISDKGLNTSKNIETIVEKGDGYVFSQILRGKKGKRYHEALFSEDGYVVTKDSDGVILKKYKEFIEEYEVIIDGKKTIKKRKVFIYYNINDALRARRKRYEKILKAQKALKNNAYGIEHSFSKYIKKEFINKKTGELLKDVASSTGLDIEKIEKDEMFDGYFCLITSELDYDYKKVREVYHQLSEIEDTFRITKSNLLFRPVYHFKKENIKAHFLICYTALLIVRLMQYKLKNDSINLSVERIVKVLNMMNMQVIKGIVHLKYIGGQLDFKRFESDGSIKFNNHFDGTDQIEKDYNLIKISFNTPFDFAYVKIENFNRYFKSIKFHITTA